MGPIRARRERQRRRPARVTLVAENAAKRVLVPTGPISNAWRGGQTFDDSAWLSGTGGVGYERSTGYQTLFKINVQTQMYGRNTTCYVRIPFNLSAADLGSLSGLTLRARCDDGFVAYLNGAEIARKNFVGEPAWNSAASASTADADAAVLASFDATAQIGKLKQGQNILAIHGLNDSTTSSDFLISVELVASKSARGPQPDPCRADGREVHGARDIAAEHTREGASAERQHLERLERGGVCGRAGGREPAHQRDHVPSARYGQS